MWPDRVSNQAPLSLESEALPTALCGPAFWFKSSKLKKEKAILTTSGTFYIFRKQEESDINMP